MTWFNAEGPFGFGMRYLTWDIGPHVFCAHMEIQKRQNRVFLSRISWQVPSLGEVPFFGLKLKFTKKKKDISCEISGGNYLM